MTAYDIILQALLDFATKVKNLRIEAGEKRYIPSLMEIAVENAEVDGTLRIEGKVVVYNEVKGGGIIYGGGELA